MIQKSDWRRADVRKAGPSARSVRLQLGKEWPTPRLLERLMRRTLDFLCVRPFGLMDITEMKHFGAIQPGPALSLYLRALAERAESEFPAALPMIKQLITDTAEVEHSPLTPEQIQKLPGADTPSPRRPPWWNTLRHG